MAKETRDIQRCQNRTPLHIRLILTIVGILAVPLKCPAQEHGRQFLTAMEAYKSGDYAAAVKVLEAIAAAGVRNGQFYYNLGNAHLKNNDLTRARDDAQKAHRIAKQQLGAFLLRHNYVYIGKTNWSKAHFNWLSDLTMPHPAQQITLQDYIDTVHVCKARLDHLTAQMREPLMVALAS